MLAGLTTKPHHSEGLQGETGMTEGVNTNGRRTTNSTKRSVGDRTHQVTQLLGSAGTVERALRREAEAAGRLLGSIRRVAEFREDLCKRTELAGGLLAQQSAVERAFRREVEAARQIFAPVNRLARVQEEFRRRTELAGGLLAQQSAVERAFRREVEAAQQIFAPVNRLAEVQEEFRRRTEVPDVNRTRLVRPPSLRFPLPAVAPLPALIRPSGNNRRNESLELTLASFEPAFAHQFRGARIRSEERGPDWLRQATASFRTLLLGLIHTAAPDELVLPWVQDRKTQLDRNGHPTRRTKIDWLCRSIQNRDFRGFVKSELHSMLGVLELFNQAVHVNEFPDLEESFTFMVTRVEFAIRQIVKLSGRQRST